MEEEKDFWASKTVWFNVITIVLAMLALPEFISLIPEKFIPVITLINGVGNVVLRMYFPSSQPLGSPFGKKK